MTNHYTCPTPDTLVYLTGTGGNPGLAAGVSNSSIALLSALGRCGDLTPQTFFVLNELTTVAAVKALAQYIGGTDSIGIYPQELADATSAFALAHQLVNINTGTAPGTNVPAGFTVPVAILDLSADIIAACVNSQGGTAGDGSTCGTLFSLTSYATPQFQQLQLHSRARAVHPAFDDGTQSDTLGAAVAIQLNPSNNTDALSALVPANSAFQPLPTGPIFSLNPNLTPLPVLNLPATFSVQSSVVGQGTVTPFVITNTSNDVVGFNPATPVSITAGDAGAQFAQTNNCTERLAAGASCTVMITFAPGGYPGPHHGFLVVNANVSNGPLSVEIDGAGVFGDYGPIMLSTNTLSFTSLQQTQTVNVTNQGSLPAPIYYQAITNNSQSFAMNSDCPASLPGGATCHVNLSAALTALQGDFSPTTHGTFLMTGNFINGPQSVSLNDSTTGRTHLCGYVGPNMGSVGVGSSVGGLYLGFEKLTATDTFTATTDADSALRGFSTLSTSSIVTAGCNYDEAAFYAISFAPTTAGAAPGTIVTSRGTIAVNGIGRTVPAAEPTSPTPNIDLAQTGVGATGSSYLQIRNSGTVLLNFKATITGPNAGDFSASGCGSVDVATTCTVGITFTPSGPGLRTATLTLTDAANNVTLQYPLSGMAVVGPPLLSVSALNFPAMTAGTTSAEMTLTVTSTTGSPVKVKTRSYDPFAVRQIGCVGTVCTYGVTFTPATDYGLMNGLLTATDSLTGGTTTIPLNGAGGQQSITIGDGSGILNFPDTAVGDAALIKLYVTNTGTSPWSVVDFGLRNTADSSGNLVYAFDSLEIGHANNDTPCLFGAYLDPGDQCFYAVQFQPPAAGADVGFLDIYTNINNATQVTVKLTGTGHN